MKVFFFFLLIFSSLHALTLEEKVGQLLMVHFYGDEINADAEKLIKEAHVGGIIYYRWANGLTCPQKVRKLSHDLQSLSSIPLLIAVDQEGGIVTRLTEGFTVFPGNAALGQSGNLEMAEKAALYMGQELKSVGINLNLAPVVDINSNPGNPVIGIRSFGNNPETVISFAKSTLKGYQKAGILTSLKHFPGHGDVSLDPHQDLPVVFKTKSQLLNLELLPFSVLKDETDTIMTAHILLPHIDPLHSATLSKELITNLLKKEMGFKGVVISDSLVMEGLLKNCTCIEEGAMMAFNAGCDILLLGGKQLDKEGQEASIDEILKIHAYLVEAVKCGKIAQAKLDESVQKILKLKEKITQNEPKIDFSEHQSLAKKIAEKALKITRLDPLDLTQKKIVVIAPKIVQKYIKKSKLSQKDSLFYDLKTPSRDELKNVKSLCQKGDVVFFFSYNAWENPSQIEIFQAIDCKVVAICLNDSADEAFFSNASTCVTTLSPTFPSIEAAIELCLH